MNQIHQEDFEALSYEERKQRTKQLIERGLQYIEARFGTEPDDGRYDVMSAAMQSYASQDFIQVLPGVQRAMSEGNMVQFTNLFGEPDRSLTLREVWASAEAELSALEDSESSE